MKALVTGATGCVGRNIVDELHEHGWKVIAVHRKGSDVSRLKGTGVTLREVDLHDPESVLSVVPAEIDAVFHAAANVSHWPLEANIQWRDNVLATRNLVRAARLRKVKRFVFTSTGATIDHAHKSPDEVVRIGCDYIRTKLMSELEVRKGIAAGLDAVIVRPAIVMGRYDYNNYGQIFGRLREGKSSIVLPGILDFNHARRDVASAHRLAFERGRIGEAYYLFGERTDWFDIYVRIARIMCVRPPVRRTPPWLLYAAAYPMLWMSHFTRRRPLLTPQLLDLLALDREKPAVEITRTRTDLGYQPTPIDEILRDSYDWLVAAGKVSPPNLAAGRR